MMKLRVVLADDHPFVLLGTRSALALHEDIMIVGEATNPAASIELLQTVACDVLVADLTMPDAAGAMDGGLRLVRRVRRDWPAVRVVVLTSLTNAAILRSVIADGAMGVLNKTAPMDELAAAIRCASIEHPHISLSVLDALDEADGEPISIAPSHCLSPREAEMIGMLVRGQSISEIARVLGRDVRAVGRQKRSVMIKLGVSNDSGLFAYFKAHGQSEN